MMQANIPVLLANAVDGKEDFMLYYELRTLTPAIRTRARQRRVEDEDMREALLEKNQFNPDGFTREIELEYPYKKHFPVLLISCVGPQHARYFHA